MNLLGAILPGFREFRTPFAVGATWVALCVVLVGTGWDALKEWSIVDSLSAVLGALPQGVILAALGFIAYLVGIISEGASAAFLRRLEYIPAPDGSTPPPSEPTRFDRFLWKVLGLRRRAAPSERVPARPSLAASRVVRAWVDGRVRSVAPWVPEQLPLSVVLNEFHIAPMRLSREAPEQYQQYDRYKAEGEFRIAMALPVLVLGSTVALMLPFWPGVVAFAATVIGSVMLLRKGIGVRDEADLMLATALYSGYTTTPMFETFLDDAKRRSASMDAISRGRDLAWLLEWLVDHEFRPEARRMLERQRHPARGFNDTVSQETYAALSPASRLILSFDETVPVIQDDED